MKDAVRENRMLVIGLTGRARSGKDTFGRMLATACRERGLRVVRRAYAWALKWEVAHAVGTRPEVVEDRKDLFRPMLQWWGTEFRRGQHADYWIERLNRRLQTDAAQGMDVAIITDLRFKNEAESLRKDWGALVWRVHRRGSMKDRVLRRLSEWLQRPHRSETEMDREPCDGVVANDRGFEELRRHAQDAAGWVLREFDQERLEIPGDGGHA